MKKLATAIAAVALIATPALAADMAVRLRRLYLRPQLFPGPVGMPDSTLA